MAIRSGRNSAIIIIIIYIYKSINNNKALFA